MEQILRLRSKNNKIGRLALYLHVLALLMFCWRSLFEFIRIHQFVYTVLFSLAVVNIFLIGKNYKHISNSPCQLYFIWGFFVFIAFLPYKGFLLSSMGIASLFLTFIIWMLSPLSSPRDNSLYHAYIVIFVGVMVANAFISIYQYNIDPSVFGLVTNRYGDESIMGMEQVTRRTVGFMGSPQSFSASSGVSLFVASTLRNKKIRLFSIGIIMIGGILSGSRAFGLYLAFFIFYIYLHQKNRNKVIITIATLLLIAIAGASIIGYILSNETISRNFTVSNWAAKSIFFSQFYDFSAIDYLIGKGYGLEGWSNQTGSLSFDYSSTESAFLSIVYQTGIIGGILFLIAYFKIYFNSHRTLFCRCLMIPMFINLCVTPVFVGFAYSYIAWGVLFMINNKKIGYKHE